MIRRFLLAVVTTFVVTTAFADPPAQSQVDLLDGACGDNVGVTVVIDFQELGGGVNMRCAPGQVTSGLDAFGIAGIAWEGAVRQPGFVCRIAGKPGPGSDPCLNASPDTAYWSYWVAPRGGSWCYSNFGAGNRTPPPGSIEGWSFALNRSGSDVPPPRVAPPAAIPGEAPIPLSTGDCGAPTVVPATSTATTTVPPSPLPAPTSTAAAVSITTPVDPGGGEPGAGNPGDGRQSVTTVRPRTSPPTTVALPSTTTNTAARPATTVRATMTTDPDATTISSVDDDVGSEGDAGRDGDVAGGVNDSMVPLGSVNLGADGRGDGGFGASTLLGILLVAALTTAGIVAARRRRPTT